VLVRTAVQTRPHFLSEALAGNLHISANIENKNMLQLRFGSLKRTAQGPEMNDKAKTKTQLINELEELRKTIYELKTTEEELKKAKDALSIVFDAVDSTVGGIIIANNDGQITYVNPSFLRMFEYTEKSQIIGKDAAELFRGEEIRTFTDVQAIVDLTSGATEEFSVQTEDGRLFIVEVSCSNVTNSEGTIVGKMASFVDITKHKQLDQEREQLIQRLQDALSKIKVLRGLIPICASCKSIRDDKGYWHKVEEYIRDHSDAQLSHGVCPTCAKKFYPELYESKNGKNRQVRRSAREAAQKNHGGQARYKNGGQVLTSRANPGAEFF
jgi:PAS domain S-box-containing protein